jgi:NAD(P)H-dependent FMN reductase
MRLTVFNGSPRGKSGNTEILLQKVIDGFSTAAEADIQWVHLNNAKKRETADEAFASSDLILLGFPLYTDAMPGLTKEFIESLAPFIEKPDNPRMAFLVQSGFPESSHSRYVERYLEKLARRLNAPYAGTVAKGGCEGVRIMPPQMNQKLFDGLMALGKDLGQSGQFDPERLKKLAKPERYPKVVAPLFKLVLKLPAMQQYWNSQLKKNNAYEQRLARPFKN